MICEVSKSGIKEADVSNIVTFFNSESEAFFEDSHFEQSNFKQGTKFLNSSKQKPILMMMGLISMAITRIIPLWQTILWSTEKRRRCVLCCVKNTIWLCKKSNRTDVTFQVYIFLLLRPSSLADNVACCVVTQIQFVYVRASQWRMRQIHCESHINIWVHHFTKFQRRNNVP